MKASQPTTIAAAGGRWGDFYALFRATSATLLGLLVTAAMGSWRLLVVLGLWQRTPTDPGLGEHG
jgi:hypothetical protein